MENTLKNALESKDNFIKNILKELIMNVWCNFNLCHWQKKSCLLFNKLNSIAQKSVITLSALNFNKYYRVHSIRFLRSSIAQKIIKLILISANFSLTFFLFPVAMRWHMWDFIFSPEFDLFTAHICAYFPSLTASVISQTFYTLTLLMGLFAFHKNTQKNLSVVFSYEIFI